MTMNQSELKPICLWCKNVLNANYEQSANYVITSGACINCTGKFFNSNDPAVMRESLEILDAPILVLQPEPRQVYTANKKACALFGKDLSQIEGFRGGQVFDCIQSFTELGCGKDANCENCKIKGAIVDTFSGNSFTRVASPLDVKKSGKTINYILEISTEKAGDFALVRIDKYMPTSNE